MGAKVDAMLAERGRRADQRVGALNGQLSGKPRPPQNPRFGPVWRREIVLGAQMLGQRGEQGIPAFVADRLWFGLHEPDLGVSRFPAILLKELPHQLPPNPLIHGRSQVLSKIASFIG
jgi:hypothetical protein